MSKKVELQQLQSMSLDEVKAHKKDALVRKAELETAKAKGGKDWNPALQEELDEIVLLLVDIDDIIEEKQAKEDKGYTPEKGSEKMVHLSIVQGRRFSSTTGKELSKPFVQKFTYAEWQLFKKNFKGLGYSIMAVLHDPYNEAKDYVVKEQE